jgi:hydrogenase maturation protease
MLSKEEVLRILESVIIAGDQASLVSKNLVKEVLPKDGAVNIVIADTGLTADDKESLKGTIRDAINNNTGFEKLDIIFEETRAADINRVKNVITVMSGKGGVGKSLVSGLLAVALRRKGHEVGILDADIVGPSIPRMFGLSGQLRGFGKAIVPLESKIGIEVVSMNLLLENECDPVIWRGPIISGAIKQFWEDALWGSLDDLIVDLPPGTTDASLTVMQSLPITGVIIVTTPQDLVEMIVKKAVNMVKEMNKPIIGIIENMSYLLLPGTDEKVEIFGRSRVEEVAREIGVPLLGRLPIDPEIARHCDKGTIELYNSEILQALEESLIQAMATNKFE